MRKYYIYFSILLFVIAGLYSCARNIKPDGLYVTQKAGEFDQAVRFQTNLVYMFNVSEVEKNPNKEMKGYTYEITDDTISVKLPTGTLIMTMEDDETIIFNGKEYKKIDIKGLIKDMGEVWQSPE